MGFMGFMVGSPGLPLNKRTPQNRGATACMVRMHACEVLTEKSRRREVCGGGLRLNLMAARERARPRLIRP